MKRRLSHASSDTTSLQPEAKYAKPSYRSCTELVEWLENNYPNKTTIDCIKTNDCDEWTLLNVDENVLMEALRISWLHLHAVRTILQGNDKKDVLEEDFPDEFINRYNLIKVLGKGGFGKVYKVTLKKDTNIIRAVKIIKEDKSKNFTINDALKEVLQTQKVSHVDNVVKIHDAFISKNHSLLIEMDCFDYGSLHDYFIRNDIKPSHMMIISIIEQIFGALEIMKEKHNMIHRDVKLGNILIREIDFEKDNIEVCLADFGLARSFGEDSVVSHIYGTPNHLAPELLTPQREKQPYSIASDIFGLGAALCYLFAKTGYNDNLDELISSDYASPFVEVLDIMLSNNVKDRDLNNIRNHICENITKISKCSKFWETFNISTMGNAFAQFNLGVMYKNGKGCEQSNEKAFEWFQKSANQGNAYAQYTLGYMYDNGEGCEQSNEKAFEWYQKSANQGHADAQHDLGCMYDNGEGCEQSNEKAFEWFQKSANQGNADAQYSLGYMYKNEEGCEQSNEKAFEWYQKSANQGNADAQYSLGYMYKNGEGCEQSNEKAFEWFQKSANQGHAEAKKIIQKLLMFIHNIT